MKFLVPALESYGSVFAHKYSQAYKLGAGIFDLSLTGMPHFEEKKHIFILFNKSMYTSHFMSFLNWLKNQEYYVTDYEAPSLNRNFEYHMIVIDFPFELHSAYNNFLEGKYSKMYTSEQITQFFGKAHLKESCEILLRKENAVGEYLQKIKKIYGDSVELSVNDVIVNDHEVEFPYVNEEEIFIINH